MAKEAHPAPVSLLSSVGCTLLSIKVEIRTCDAAKRDYYICMAKGESEFTDLLPASRSSRSPMEISLSEAQAALGDHLDLTLTALDSSEIISFTASIIKIFAPITKSVVVHTRILESSASLPATAVLKLYDPRFTDERLPIGHALKNIKMGIGHPWSLDLEVASVQRREAIRRGELEDNFLEELSSDSDPILWEENLYR